MRFLVVVRSKHRVDRADFPGLVEAFAAWREKYRSVSESFEAFVGGKGGYGVVDVDDAAALHQMLIEYPFAPTSDIQTYPIIDGDKAIAMWREFAKAMAGGG
jgi:muconolactone delta-isomerase